MLGLVITTEDKMYKKDFSEPLFLSIMETIGGFEIVNPVGLPHPFCFMVDGDFQKKKLPVNPVGTAWYDALPNKIQGDIVVMKRDWMENGPDIVGLTEDECETIINLVYELTDETCVLIPEPEHVVL